MVGLGLSEHEYQTLVVDWLDMIASRSWPQFAVVDGWAIDSGKSREKRPRWRLPFYATPNGGLRAKKTAGELKAEGQRSGVPDICLAVPRGGYAGLYVEMKTESGSASKAQKAWRAALEKMGYRVEVCKGHHKAIAVITAYLNGTI